MVVTTVATRGDFMPVRSRWAGVAATVALHALALGVVLTHAPAREALREAAPLMVELITPASPAPPQPKAGPKVDTPLKPRPMRKFQPLTEPETPLLATASPASPPPVMSAPVESRPLPAMEAKPAPATPPAPPAPPAPAAPAAPAPVVVPPSFSADYLDNPTPAYPTLSRRIGEQGRVLLRVFVETSGMPGSVEVRTSSGYERLDQAAVEAVRRWKFVPAKSGDRTVAAFVIVPIAFTLRN